MIALTLSALVAAYLLIPNALFRLLLGFFLPVKAFSGGKAEEITRAVVTLFVLFLIALFLVWYSPVCKTYPLSFSDNAQQRSFDYRIVASGLYSESLFKEHEQEFWQATWRSLKRQGRFLFWYYVLVGFVAVGLGRLSKHYGKMRGNRFYSWFADIYLLPHISQWHALLTGFTFPAKTSVKADVLMTDDTLYSGEVADYFLNSDGSLAGIFLRNPKRFDRPRYLKEKAEWGLTRSVEKFWRSIPSAKLYLIGSQIVNLNLNYDPQTASASVVQKYVDGIFKGSPPAKVTLRPPGPPENLSAHAT